VKTAVPNSWNVYGSADGTSSSNVDLGAGPGNPLPLTFNTSGAMTTVMPANMSLDLNGVAAALGKVNGAASPQAFSLQMVGTTQFGSDFSVNTLDQDGYPSGTLSGLLVGNDGVIQGRYSNGQAKNLGQLVLANFNNNQALKPLGNSLWSETPESGIPLIGTPSTGTFGVTQSSAIEDSNVDLTAELVNMITMQRVYQANAQSIKTQDQVTQTLVNLR
jgi:flagellar hook protein FlgE